MQLNITDERLAKILGGVLAQKVQKHTLTSLSIDTRAMQKGQIYWAIKGHKHDGHDFIKDAVDKGAALVIAEHGRAQEAIEAGAGVIEVSDTLLALQTLAKYQRERSHARIAAITGSNGKSTTKQMLLSIASNAGKTAANPGNLNNQIGV
ncbi:MAG: Mur ligase domain-containing protein, partial [Elusimicrobiota bacterium]|nr:Mur ligase domain-containing protein [Elusimicrobiota bacterium]